MPTIPAALKEGAQVYKTPRFIVKTALMDCEFQHLWGDLGDVGITLNETGWDKYVGDIKCYIHVVKERMNHYYNMFPFKRIPV